MNNLNHNIENSSIELIQFINKVKQTKKINYKQIYRVFAKCVAKSVIEMDTKFKSLQSSNESIISGINMIYHIYYILIVYSNNIKLTIFLLERAILLYTEFIIMSQDKNMVEEIYFVPNINDAISFSFKKTIGAIKLNDIDTNSKNIQFIKNICRLLRNLYKLYYKSDNVTDNILFSFNVDSNISSIDNLFSNELELSDSKYNNHSNEYYLDNNTDNNSDNNSDNNTNNNPENNINNNLDDEQIYNYNKSVNLSLKQFLNIISNELVESLLNLNNHVNYLDIISKIDYLINNNDCLNVKIGKLKIYLYIVNREYLYNNSKFNTNNEVLLYLKSSVNYKYNIIYKDILERFFEQLVTFTFSEDFKHNIDESSNIKLSEESIINQLNEIFEYIK